MLTLHNNFPYGAVATSVLALIGLEDIMSEYFSDSRQRKHTGFHSGVSHNSVSRQNHKDRAGARVR